MNDSLQSQPVSSAWIGKRVCVKESNYGTLRYLGDIITTNGKWCGIELDESMGENDGMINNERYFTCKDKHGIFVPMSEIKLLHCKMGQNILGYSSNDPMYFGSQKQLNGIEDQHFSFDLSTEKDLNKKLTDFRSDGLVKLNETFNISVGNAGQIECAESQTPEDTVSQTINLPTIKSVYFSEEKASIEMDSEKFGVLNKTIILSPLKSENMLKENVFTRLDSEESLGIIPEVLEDSLELLGSCSNIFNNRNETNSAMDTDYDVCEVFSRSPNCHDLKEHCFKYINEHLGNNIRNSNYTSTPKQDKNFIDSDSSVVFPQDKYPFLLQDEVKEVDESILYGSSHIVSQIFDAEEFDKDPILTSTSKLASLLRQSIRNCDLLNKTSTLNCEDLNFKYKEVNGIHSYENLRESSKEPLDTDYECKELEAVSTLNQTNIINCTFEVKPESSPHEVFSSRHFLDTSLTLHKKGNILNKTILVGSVNNSPEMLNDTFEVSNDTIRNSNSFEHNRTHTLISCNLSCQPMNATFSEMVENQNYDMQLNEYSIPATEMISLCKTSTKLRNYSSRESISLPIISSVGSFKTAAKDSSLISKINTSIKNRELLNKQSTAERINRRYSLSAYPTLRKTDSVKLDSFKKSLPGQSKCDYLHRSKPRLSSVKSKTATDEVLKKFTNTANSDCLPKPLPPNAFGKLKKSVNTYGNSNSLASKSKIVQPKKLKDKEAHLKGNVGLQTVVVVKTSLDGTFVKDDISMPISLQERDTKSDSLFSSSFSKGNIFKDKNKTFSDFDKIYDVEDITVSKQGNSETTDEISSKDHAIQIKESPTDKYVAEMVNRASLKSKILIETEAASRASLGCSFSKNDISKKLSLQKTIKADCAFLSSVTETNNDSKNKNRTFSASDDFYNEKTSIGQEVVGKISCKNTNDHSVQIEKSLTDHSITETVNTTETKSDSSVAYILDKTFSGMPNEFHDKNSKDISEKSTIKCKNINSNVSLKCRVKGIFSKPVNRQRLAFVPNIKSQVSTNVSKSKEGCKNKHIENKLQHSSKLPHKNLNNHSFQIKEISTHDSVPDVVNVTELSVNNSNVPETKNDYSVADVSDKTYTDMLNDSHEIIFKKFSDKSAEESSNMNSNASFECVNNVFLKPVDEPELSFVPTQEFRVSRSLSESKDGCKIEHNEDELHDVFESINDRTVEIKESSTDNSVTDFVKLMDLSVDNKNVTEMKSDNSVTAVPDKTFTDILNDSHGNSSNDASEKSTNDCKNINSNVSLKCRVKGIFSKPVNKQRFSFLPTLKSQVSTYVSKSKEGCKSKLIVNKLQGPSEVSYKNTNDCFVQTKEFITVNSEIDVVNLTEAKSDISVADVPNKTFTEVLNDFQENSNKDISEKSAEEYSNINSSASVKCVKSTLSKPVNKPGFSVPTKKCQVSRSLSEKGKCENKHIESKLKITSTISSKQYCRSIQIPRFHLKSSSGNVKETVRSQEKPLQKENIASNSASLGMKDSNQKSYRSGDSETFCHTGRVVKPIIEKSLKVPTVSIPRKEYSDSVKLKPVQSSRILSSATRLQSLPQRKIQAPSSQRIR